MDNATQTPEDRQAQLEDLVKQYQAIHDPAKRSEFFHANPRLAEVFSALNHPPKPVSGPSTLNSQP